MKIIWKNVDLEKINRTNLGNIKLDDLTLSLSGTGISLAVEVLRNIRFNQIKGSIVCIDDLERKSKLSLEEILGFVEYLVQEIKCKIILIYNEDALLKDPDNETILTDYREKVIDREFTLDPTVDENLDILLRGIHNLEPDNLEVFKEIFKKVGTNNIRVIKKTIWLIDELILLMKDKDWEDSLRHQVITNSIIINLAKIDSDFYTRFPNIKVTKPAFSSDILKDKIQEEIGNINLLEIYFNFRRLKEIDEMVLQLFKISVFNEDDFKQIGSILNERDKKSKFDVKIRLLRELCYNSFADNEKEMSDEIINFLKVLKEHHLDLSISEFDQIQQVASKVALDISNYEKSLVENTIQIIFDDRLDNELLTLQEKLAKYPDLYTSFIKKKEEYYQRLDITTVLTNIFKPDLQHFV